MPFPNQTGGIMRKDGSGVRGGVDRRPRSRQDDFPYDAPIVYGKPTTPGKHTGRAADDGRGFVPDDPFDHDAWADIAEAIGVPFDLSISSRGTRTSTVPGGPSNGGVNPSGSEWAVAPAGDRVFSRGTSSNVSQRGAFTEAWVSLNSLALSPMEDSEDLEQEFLSSLQDEFGDAVDALERAAAGFSTAEKLLMMFDLDPDHTANSLADVGDEKVDSIYRSWRDPALPPPADEGDIE
jgi:hypothetical protein